MDLHICSGLPRAMAVGAFAISMFFPGAVSAADEGGQGSTGTLVGSVTCGADEITPAANAVVSVTELSMRTRADSGGHFTLSNVPVGQRIRIDAATDPQQSSMSSRFDVAVEPGQTLDVGSLDVAVCPPAATPTATTTDQDMEQRANPND